MLTQMESIPKIKIGSSYLERVVKTKSLGLIIDDNLRCESTFIIFAPRQNGTLALSAEQRV